MEYKGLSPDQLLFKLLTSKHYTAIIPHASPDGDALGTALALYDFIKSFHSNVKIISKDPPPENTHFLPNLGVIAEDINTDLFPVLCFVDCSNQEISKIKLSEKKQQFIINIDHHSTNSMFGHLNYVKKDKASTTQILFELFRKWNFEITPNIATYLLTGLYFDTGTFKHANTTKQTFKMAAELSKISNQTPHISYNLFQRKTISQLKLWGKIFKTCKINNQKILSAIIYEEDFEKFKASKKATEGIIDYLNAVQKKNISLLLTAQKDTIKGSLRSLESKFPVNQIAQQLGGGGHKLAAGFQVSAKLKQKTVWEVETSQTE